MGERRNTTVTVVLLTGLMMNLVACDDAENTSDGPDSASVPVSGPAGDQFEVKGEATVTNEEFYEGDFGYVTISARTATTEPESNRHYFGGVLTLSVGQSVECEEPRDHLWSKYGVFEDIGLKCGRKVTLGEVESFALK